MPKKIKALLLLPALILFFGCSENQESQQSSQKVIIVVIDGARYTETFGADAKYIPRMYNELKPLGTVYSNFRIAHEGITSTCPGHSSILTGTWQQIENDGTERPTNPTLFELHRKLKRSTITENFVIAGKEKLHVLAYSTDPLYGIPYKASEICSDTTDSAVYNNLVSIMDRYHPKLIIANFPEVDRRGHDSVWSDYLKALTYVDSLVYLLWQKIQSDPFYKDNTTLFVTNDHGRHTTDFSNHADDCEGCEHIMLLALGKDFPQNTVNPDLHHQIDLCKTIGDIMGFETPQAAGKSLLGK